jgi:NAD(P) transhydrogenase
MKATEEIEKDTEKTEKTEVAGQIAPDTKVKSTTSGKFDYDILVIGSGPAGERAALQAAKLGRRAAIIERHSVIGGVMIHTGTLPSKTLRETVLYIAGLRQRSIYGLQFELKNKLTIKELMHRKANVIQKEMEVISDQLSRNGVDVITGYGILTSPHQVLISSGSDTNRIVTAGKIIVSVGTHPYHPPGLDFDNKYIYDGETILELDEIPRTLTIVGGGVIGCEYACIFAHIGVKVTLLDKQKHLLGFIDDEISDVLVYLMRKYRVKLILGDGAKDISVRDGKVVTITQAGRRIVSDRMLYSAGRGGNTENLGLEALNIETDKRGLIKVDEHFKTSCDTVYAVGDVIGFPSLASVSMDQGRIASYHALNSSGETRNPVINELMPYGIYTIPELSLVGETEESAREKGEEFEVGISRFHELARGQIMNDQDGLLKLIFRREDRRLLGVHIIGERATELIHIGQAVMSFGGTIDYFIDSVFNYPTLSEAYKVAALDGISRMG